MPKRKERFRNPAPAAPTRAPLFSGPRVRDFLGAVCIVAAALVVYGPSIHGGFILDDELLLTGNPIIRASDGLYRFWCTTEPVDYWPATNTTLWIEWRLWGMNPTGYHATNLALHVAACLLLWYALRRLSIPGAWLAAMLFAVHPVNVESVAWISQRKNVLALVFFLLSAIWYLRADEGKKGTGPICAQHPSGRSGKSDLSPFFAHGGWYAASLLAFILAMLAKGSVATLPALLLVVVWWRRGLSWWDALRTAPLFVVAGALSVVNVWFQSHHGEAAVRDAGFVERLLGAGAAVWFYLAKAVVPVDLAFVYPKWDIRPTNPLWWLPLGAAVAATVGLWAYRRRWSRSLLAAWLFFGAALAPVLGFADVGFMKYSLVADHYLHIALLAVVALAAAGWSVWRRRSGRAMRQAAYVVAGAVVVVLMALAAQQSELYRDGLTLYQAAIAENPDCSLLHNNLGREYTLRGQSAAAIEHYRRAIVLEPDYFEPHNNLGIELRRTGQLPEAIEQYEAALKLHPDVAQTLNNLGEALEESGRLPEAKQRYEEALRLTPDYPEALLNLGNAYSKEGRAREAVEHYQRALRVNPNYAEALYNLGIEVSKSGQLTEAIACYRRAVDAKPKYAEAHLNLGTALAQTGQLREAIPHFEQAARLLPNSPDVHYNLGKAYCDSGNLSQAAAHYQMVLRLQPRSAEAWLGLAETYAKGGRRNEAVAAGHKALALAKAAGQTPLAKTVEQWLKSYEAAGQ